MGDKTIGVFWNQWGKIQAQAHEIPLRETGQEYLGEYPFA